MYKLLLPLLFSAACFLSGCGASDTSIESGTSDLDSAVKLMVDNTILPTLQSLQSETATLQNTVESFCTTGNANLTAGNLTTLQAQWHSTNAAWYRLAPFKFGPLVYGDAYEYIDSYHSRGSDELSAIRSYITSFLAGTDSISILANKSGLPVLEVALFETSNQDTTTLNIVNEYTGNARRCALLTGHTMALQTHINLISSQWNTDYRNRGQSYRDMLINQTLDNEFSAFDDDGDGTTAMGRITLAAQDFFDLIANHDITSEKDHFSNGKIWNALEESINSIELMLEGQPGDFPNLFDIMKNNGHNQNIAAVQDNIDTFKTTLEDTDKINLTAISSALDGNFKNAIPDSLNISLGLTFTDGDG